MHSVKVLTLDVQNDLQVFNRRSPREYSIPEYFVRILRSWLSDRTILVGEGHLPKTIARGVHQGSVLGLTLRNVVYDGLLSTDVPVGVRLIGFAVIYLPGGDGQAGAFAHPGIFGTVL